MAVTLAGTGPVVSMANPTEIRARTTATPMMSTCRGRIRVIIQLSGGSRETPAHAVEKRVAIRAARLASEAGVNRLSG
jgi:hypothetical protein